MEISNSIAGKLSVCLLIILNETKARLGGVKGGRQVSCRDSLSFLSKAQDSRIFSNTFHLLPPIFCDDSRTLNSIKFITLTAKI